MAYLQISLSSGKLVARLMGVCRVYGLQLMVDQGQRHHAPWIKRQSL